MLKLFLNDWFCTTNKLRSDWNGIMGVQKHRQTLADFTQVAGIEAT